MKRDPAIPVAWMPAFVALVGIVGTLLAVGRWVGSVDMKINMLSGQVADLWKYVTPHRR